MDTILTSHFVVYIASAAPLQMHAEQRFPYQHLQAKVHDCCGMVQANANSAVSQHCLQGTELVAEAMHALRRNQVVMTSALAMHDNLLRALLHQHCGYEVSAFALSAWRCSPFFEQLLPVV